MNPLSPKYTFPVPAPAQTQGVEAGAGVYLLDGRCHVAATRSSAEAALQAAGAMLIALLRFDRDPRERLHPGHPVRALGAGEAAVRFVVAPDDN